MNQPKQNNPPTTDANRGADVKPLPTEDMVEIGSEQHPHTADDHSQPPRSDHSERQGGSDQDIDTSGQVP